jgi:hypothetical protein
MLMGDQDGVQPGRVDALAAHAAVDFPGGKTGVDQDGGGPVGHVNGIAPAAAAEDADGQLPLYRFDRMGRFRAHLTSGGMHDTRLKFKVKSLK